MSRRWRFTEVTCTPAGVSTGLVANRPPTSRAGTATRGTHWAMVWGARDISSPSAQMGFIIRFIAVPEAEKFDGFLSVSEGIPWLITKRDLGFSHDFTPTPPSTLSFGVSAVPPSHRNPGKYA